MTFVLLMYFKYNVIYDNTTCMHAFADVKHRVPTSKGIFN